ncbi:hypothetical protein KC19_VG213200 [Ceratodon purpureus]|uniref:histidine kinase n=1 Tax=Ceratodon purpureus TaxID=3225 RepID=A0A8T0HSU6_CERPU|nr:hypothetical protein KC19_VG213200 [Ceratodon purpureus]
MFQSFHLEKEKGEQVRQSKDKAHYICAAMWGSMTKWFTLLLRGCKRRRRPRVVHVLDPENEHHDSGFRRPRRRTYYYSMFSVRLAIMIMLAVLIALLTILTWHFTTVYTTRSIKNLAYGLRTELLNRPIARMWNLLNNTVEATLSQVQLAQFVVGQFTLPIDPASQVAVHKTMRNVTWAIFAGRKSAKSVTVAYRNGQLQAFDRDTGNNQSYYLFTNPLNATALGGLNLSSPLTAPAPDPPVTMWPDVPMNDSKLTWYAEAVDPSTGITISPPQPTDSFDFTKDVDAVLQLRDNEVSWRVTVSDYEDSPLLSSAAPIRHVGSNTVVAVVGITTALSSISGFLRELTSSHSGYLYLTTESGQLLATSTSSSLINSSGPGRSLILANESSDPVIKAGAQWLNERYSFEGLVQKVVHAENILLEGKRFYIDTFSLVLPRLQMVGVILIPRTYVMGEVDRRGKATLAILIAISSCILLVGCIFIIFFTSGVSTEMKLRAELINHLDARRRAEASSNYKSQFLANMSHELRTPMAAVIGLLDILLCDDCLSSEQVNMVSQIRRCSTALLRLLNNILDISKVESGKFVLEAADFDLNRELEGLVDMFSVQCVDHSTEIVLDLADDMPRVVRGDSARTVQIFANLIANSVKFTSSGHVILRGWCGSSNMSAAALRNELLFGTNDNSWDQNRLGHESVVANNPEPEQFLLWFEVEDTGCGIDASKWEAVFDSFVQADPSTTRTYGGTGLGLCIVRSLVRKMGGDIKIVKKEGPGTLLRFYLLFGQPHDSEPDAPRLSLPAELDNAKVLLAMKGDVARGTLAQWMHYRGFSVYEASEWDETIQVLNDLLADEQRVSWEKGTDNNEFVVPLANYRKTGRPHSSSRDAKEIPDDEVSLVLSGNSGHWKMQNFKLLAVLDSELIPWSDDSNQVVSMLSVLDEFRDRGIMISWLFTHDTPNALKTQLRRTGYSITANQPLYKSKLFQLLSSMVGCLERGSSRDSKWDLETMGSGRCNSGYYDDIKSAALDRHELEKLQSQSKLGLSGARKSLPKVLERRPSKELAGVKNISSDDIKTGQCGLAVDMHALQQNLERFPVPGNNLERTMSISLSPSDVQSITPSQQPDEQESINLNNLGPAASPGSSSASSTIGSPRIGMMSLKPHHLSGGSDSLSLILPLDILNGDKIAGDQVVDIPPVLSNLSNDRHSGSSSFPDAPDRPEPNVTKTQALSTGSLHNIINEPSTIARIVDQAVIENPRHLHEQVDRSAKAGSKSGSESGPPLHAIGSQPGSLETAKGVVSPAQLTFASRPPVARPSTRNAIAKKPPANRPGPGNALAGIRILLAEDTPVLAKVATIMLEKMGARVVAVGDGLQAVETIGRSRGNPSVVDGETSTSSLAVNQFDLVLMDCQMPKMDGYDATKAIRKAEEGRDWHLPIVALTAHAMSSDEAKCLQVGMDAYLTKPIDSKLMVSTILGLTKKGPG